MPASKERQLSLPSRVHSLTVALLTVAGIAFFLLMALFTERQWGGEERALYNIPYTLVHEGRVAFPAYGYLFRASYDRVFVHPPTHYVEVGLWMKAGLPLYYAEAVPTVLWAVIALLVIAAARFSPVIQIGLLTGTISAVGYVATIGSGDYGFHVRPDAHMGFALLAGFLALAAAQVQGWEYKRLFLGSFAVTYGSTLHYPGWCAWTGLAAFLFVAFRELPWPQFWRRLLVVAAGGCLAGVPYLVFHIIPNWPYVTRYSGYVSADQIARSIRDTFPIYRGTAQQMQNWPFPLLFYAWPLKQALAWGIPPFLLALALLVWFRQTRALAISILPFSIFIVAVFSRKMFPYHYLESMLALIGLWLAAAGIWMMLSGLLPSRWRTLASPLFAVLFLIAFWRYTPELVRVQWKRQRHEFGFLRARAKEIMGSDATIASIHPLWYIGGAARWFDLSNDLLENLTPVDLRTYVSRFDAVAMLNMPFYGTYTGVNEASLYETGIVRLRGFLESRIQTATRWVFLSERHDQPVSGYFWKDERLFKFQEAAAGRHMLASMVMSGDVQGFLKAFAPLQYWALDLPKVAGRQETRYVLILLLDEQHYAQGASLLASAKPLELIRGNVQQVDLASLAPPAADADPIVIPRSYSELLDLLSKPSRHGLRERLELARYSGTAKVEALPSRPGWNHLEGPSVKLQWLGGSQLPKLAEGKYYRVSFDIEIQTGGLSAYIVRDQPSETLESVYREVPLKHGRVSFVFQSRGDQPLFLVLASDNVFGPAPTSFNVTDPAIEEVDVPGQASSAAAVR